MGRRDGDDREYIRAGGKRKNLEKRNGVERERVREEREESGRGRELGRERASEGREGREWERERIG